MFDSLELANDSLNDSLQMNKKEGWEMSKTPVHVKKTDTK
jgi:hypothetical protein